MEIELAEIRAGDEVDIDEEDEQQNGSGVREVSGTVASQLRFGLDQCHSLACGDRRRACISTSLAILLAIVVIILSVGGIIAIVLAFSSTAGGSGSGGGGSKATREVYRPTRSELQRHMQSVAVWRAAFAAALAGGPTAAPSLDPASIDQIYFRDCWNDTDFFRMVYHGS